MEGGGNREKGERERTYRMKGTEGGRNVTGHIPGTAIFKGPNISCAVAILLLPSDIASLPQLPSW